MDSDGCVFVCVRITIRVKEAIYLKECEGKPNRGRSWREQQEERNDVNIFNYNHLIQNSEYWNIGEYFQCVDLLTFGWVPSNGIGWSYGNSNFRFLRNLCVDSHSGWTSLSLHQLCIAFPFGQILTSIYYYLLMTHILAGVQICFWLGSSVVSSRSIPPTPTPDRVETSLFPLVFRLEFFHDCGIHRAWHT